MNCSRVVVAAGFGVGAAHIEAAERVNADQRARALAVDVEVADEEFVLGLRDPGRIARVDRAGQAELGPVGDRQRVVEAVGRGSRPAPGRRSLLARARAAGSTSAKTVGSMK